MYKPKLVLLENSDSFLSKIGTKLQRSDTNFGGIWYFVFFEHNMTLTEVTGLQYQQDRTLKFHVLFGPVSTPQSHFSMFLYFHPHCSVIKCTSYTGLILFLILLLFQTDPCTVVSLQYSVPYCTDSHIHYVFQKQTVLQCYTCILVLFTCYVCGCPHFPPQNFYIFK